MKLSPRNGIVRLVLLALALIVVTSCVSGDTGDDAVTQQEDQTSGVETDSTTPSPSSATQTATKVDPTSIDTATATEAMAPSTEVSATATAEELSTPSVPTSIEIEIPQFVDESAVPDICQSDATLNLFKEFVRRYNAGDLDGVMALIQEERPGWLPGPQNERKDWIPFLWFSTSEFQAKTHADMRAYLEQRFEIHEQLRLERIVLAPTWNRTDSSRVDSDRNADFGLQMERWSDQESPHSMAVKGGVDCDSQKIYLWSGATGTL